MNLKATLARELLKADMLQEARFVELRAVELENVVGLLRGNAKSLREMAERMAR